MIGFIIGVFVGVIVTAAVPRIYKWATKQVNDAKTHLPE